MKRLILSVSAGILLLSHFSCTKEPNHDPEKSSDAKSLNGDWVIGDYTQMRLGRDSILIHEGWIKDTAAVTDPGWSKWIHPTDSFLRLSTNGSDTTWLNYSYIGDGYCCNVQTIDINADSYLAEDTISINTLDYFIIEHSEDVDPDYRYCIDVAISEQYNGCYEYYKLFKRAND